MEQFVHEIVERNVERFLALWSNQHNVRLDDPILGRFDGLQNIKDFFIKASNQFVHPVENVNLIRSIPGNQIALECLAKRKSDKLQATIPLVIVFDLNNEEKIIWARIYHGTWILKNASSIRKPLLKKDPSIKLKDVVGQYQKALGEGNIEAIVQIFSEDGYIRPPSGDKFAMKGLVNIEKFFQELFSFGGGAKLEHCTVIDDGINCAIEFNIVKVGKYKVSRSKTNGIMGVSADIVDVKISDRYLGVYTSNL